MQCMKLIAFDSFNNARMNLIVEEFLTLPEATNGSYLGTDESNTTLLVKPLCLSSPRDVAKVEPLFFVGTRQSKVAPLPIHFGVSLDEFVTRTGKSGVVLEGLLYQAFQNDKYLLATETRHGRHPTVVVSFLHHASPEEHAKAYYHAILLSRQLNERGTVNEDDFISAEAIAQEELERSWDAFSHSCQESGWNLGKTQLQSQGYELELIENKLI